jgi:hypothetical protein
MTKAKDDRANGKGDSRVKESNFPMCEAKAEHSVSEANESNYK